MDKERKRVPNFTVDEKMHLFNIVKSYAKALEDKKTNRSSQLEKNRVWLEIEKKFNSSSPNTYPRSAATLKLLYENKKKDLRRKMGEEKKQRFMTGGGPMPSVKLDPIEEMLLSVVNEKSVNGLDNMFDSDNQTKIIKPSSVEYILEVSQDTEITNAESSKTEENESLGQNEEDMPTVSTVAESSNGGKKNWRKYTPTDLQLPTTSALKPKGVVHRQTERTNGQKSTSRRRPTQSISTLTSSQVAAKYNLLLDRRLVLIEKQIQSIDDEQEFLKTERKLKIELLKVKVAYEKSSMLVSCSNKEI